MSYHTVKVRLHIMSTITSLCEDVEGLRWPIGKCMGHIQGFPACKIGGMLLPLYTCSYRRFYDVAVESVMKSTGEAHDILTMTQMRLRNPCSCIGARSIAENT